MAIRLAVRPDGGLNLRNDGRLAVSDNAFTLEAWPAVTDRSLSFPNRTIFPANMVPANTSFVLNMALKPNYAANYSYNGQTYTDSNNAQYAAYQDGVFRILCYPGQTLITNLASGKSITLQPFAGGVWGFLTITYDFSTATFTGYKNGVRADLSTGSGQRTDMTTFPALSALNLGFVPSSPTVNAFIGEIDDVRVGVGFSLSAAQVASTYNVRSYQLAGIGSYFGAWSFDTLTGTVGTAFPGYEDVTGNNRRIIVSAGMVFNTQTTPSTAPFA